ncbi:MAG: tungstate ABC transporter substrate-binding protein WtpA [Methanomicrobiales archaeon]
MKVISVSWVLVLAIIAVLFVLTAGCTGTGKEKVPLRVYCAGSLIIPFGEAEKEFEALHPGVDVQLEPHGSIQVIRQITDLHRPGDVVAVADESLIPDLMYRRAGVDGTNYTDWYLPFGGNEMVIAFTNKSRYASEITEDNWYEVLSRPGVKVGLSNPMLDAAGYRALIVAKLAENEYHTSNLFGVLLGDHFDPRLTVRTVGQVTTIILPEIVKPSDDHVVVRDGSIFLLSLLEAGGIDYAFEYRSVAEGKKLRWIRLPPSINLGSPEYAKNYRTVNVILGFQRFSSIGTERVGVPIVYAVTIPYSAAHPEIAKEFVDYIAVESQKGRPGWPSPVNRTEIIRE